MRTYLHEKTKMRYFTGDFRAFRCTDVTLTTLRIRIELWNPITHKSQRIEDFSYWQWDIKIFNYLLYLWNWSLFKSSICRIYIYIYDRESWRLFCLFLIILIWFLSFFPNLTYRNKFNVNAWLIHFISSCDINCNYLSKLQQVISASLYA